MRTRFWILTLGVLLGLAARGVKQTYDALAATKSAGNGAATASDKPGETSPATQP